MKSYPRMEYFDKGIHGSYIYAFDKLDGSNIRCEWSRKRGWYKFGTRNVMIDERSEYFGDAVTIFLEKYGDELPKVFKKHYPNIESFVVFCEYSGENSFAGYHIDEPKDVVLFDVNAYKKGFVNPRDFIRHFGHLHIPEIIYQGEYNSQLIADVRNNIWKLKEGVVCKGTFKTKGSDQVWMVKIKSNEWLERVRNKLGEIALLEEVNGNRSLLL
jgi:hypothetical protein